MKKSILILCLLVTKISFSQTIPVNSKLLTPETSAQLFTENVKTDLKITLPIAHVYEYNDKAGLHYLALMENQYSNVEAKPLYDKVVLVDAISANGVLKENWRITDFIKPEDVVTDPHYSMWIWTKYLHLSDLDGDKLADPIVVYGLRGIYNSGEGKIKIITISKGKKYAIRHQNSDMDWGRNTQVDKLFYTLPVKIQTKVKEVMTKITEDGNGIFPAGWEKNMKLKKLKFDEN